MWLEGAGGGRLDEEMVAAVWGPVAAALSVVLESSRCVGVMVVVAAAVAMMRFYVCVYC